MHKSQIQGVKNANKKFLFKKEGVKSVGIGYKIVNGEVTNELCLVVGVQQKKPFTALSKKHVVPDMVDGVPTDVIEIGTPVAQSIDPTKTHRPVFPGISVGHYLITAGTIACIVYRNGEPFILSNCHVLANSNDARIEDAIYQPGPYDGGNSTLQIGTLEDFVKISFDGEETPIDPPDNPPGENPPTCGIAKSVAKAANIVAKRMGSSHRLQAVRVVKKSASSVNLVDAAIARLSVNFSEEIADIGKPVGIKEAELGMDIQKFGRTTLYTTSKIAQTDAIVEVSYGSSKYAIFENQIIAGNMSAGGDSGSAVLDMDKNIVGLLFAGSTNVTIINPIQTVFDALNVSINV